MMTKGIIFTISVLMVAFSLWVMMMPIGIVLLFIGIPAVIRLRRTYLSSVGSIFLDTAAALLMGLGGTKVVIYSDDQSIVDSNKKDHNLGVIMANHRTRIDWMFCGFCYAYILGFNSSLFIILKDSLKSAPIFGWAMQLMQFIFLSRNRDNDLPYISRCLSYLLFSASNPTVLIFPEGTDLSDSNKVKAETFAKSHQLPRLDQVLYPKSAGLLTLLKCLKDRNLKLHDVTIAYKDYNFGDRASELDLVKGRFPKEIHLIVNVYNIEDIPTEKMELDKWIRDLFYRKEVILRQFYSQISNKGDFTKPNHVINETLECIDSSGNSVSMDIDANIPEVISYQPPNLYLTILKAAIIVAAVFSSAVYIRWIRWLLILFAVIAIVVTNMNGFDALELNRNQEIMSDVSKNAIKVD